MEKMCSVQAEEEKALDLEEEEKTPMTAGDQGASADSEAAQGPEQNGAVKLKIPEEEEEDAVHFTGLNKEELLRVAGTPGWVRTRWSLLVLFWLSWLGMLAAAVLIILKAPPCKELPSLNWWNEGPLYGVRSIQDFSAAGNIRGVEQRLEHLQQLKVKGLVLGPVHVAPKDQPMALSFKEVSTESGSIIHLLITIHIIPNYGGADVWFSNSSISSISDRLKYDLVFWLTLGVDGVKLDSVDSALTLVPSQWNDIRSIVQNWTDSRPHKSALISDSGVDLLMSPVLSAQTDATERAQTTQLLSSAHAPPKEEACQSSDLLLLLTLPGTALIQSGDELGLRADSSSGSSSGSASSRASCLLLVSSLSALRSRERSLMFGDFQLLFNSSSALVFLRSWDQSPRFLALTNSSPDRALSLGAEGGALERLGGATGRVVFSSNTSILALDQELQLRDVTVGPREAALLQIL
uniref:Solute carrier family 3 member 2 N-terminal domain-containing protein n=1 Tax=Neogobius melanostomus TaxID=47308 RepID=A0A8C6WLB9_9GOBI